MIEKVMSGSMRGGRRGALLDRSPTLPVQPKRKAPELRFIDQAEVVAGRLACRLRSAGRCRAAGRIPIERIAGWTIASVRSKSTTYTGLGSWPRLGRIRVDGRKL
jgi:hypothetical protein